MPMHNPMQQYARDQAAIEEEDVPILLGRDKKLAAGWRAVCEKYPHIPGLRQARPSDAAGPIPVIGWPDRDFYWLVAPYLNGIAAPSR